MVSATELGGVAGEAAGWAAEAMVERDRGGERCESGGEADAKVLECAGAVTFEGEDVLAGLEDRLDPLADRREVWAAARFVSAAGGGGFGARWGPVGPRVLSSEVVFSAPA